MVDLQQAILHYALGNFHSPSKGIAFDWYCSLGDHFIEDWEVMRVLFLEEQESPIFLGKNAPPGFPASSSSDSYFEPSPSGNCLLNSLHIRFSRSIYLYFADSC